MSKRKLSDCDYSENTLSLQQLASDRFARWCWQQQINKRWLNFSILQYREISKDYESMRIKFAQLGSTMDISIKTMIENSIAFVFLNMNHYESSTVFKLVLEDWQTAKWRDFIYPIWKCYEEIDGENGFFMLFQRILEKIENNGLDSLCQAELKSYLDIWNNTPEKWKINGMSKFPLFESKGNVHLKTARLKNLPRDLRFATMLMMSLNLRERNKIWNEKWPELMYGASPSSLELFLKSCCKNNDQVVQFKRKWFVDNEDFDRYCNLLIERKYFDELNELLEFCVPDLNEILNFAGKIISTFFSSNSVPHTFDFLPEMSRCGGWIGKVINLNGTEPHLQIRADPDTIKRYLYFLIQHDEHNKMNEFLKFYLQNDQKIVDFRQKIFKSYFIEDECANCVTYMTNSKNFLELINRIFPTFEDRFDFKKRILYLPSTMKWFRSCLRNNGFNNVKYFVEDCFSSRKQEIDDWKDTFMTQIIEGTKQKYIFVFEWNSWRELFQWCLDSEEKLAEFKLVLPVEEVMQLFIQFANGRKRPVDSFSASFNRALKFYFGDSKEAVNFKMQKLLECEEENDVYLLLWGNKMKKFCDFETNKDRRAVLLRDLSAAK